MVRHSGSDKRRVTFVPNKLLVSLIGASVGVGLLLVAIISLVNWPFRQQRVIRSLELLSVCEVKAQTFQAIFFPEPGYLATGLKFERREKGKSVVLATARLLRGRMSWISLLTLDHRIRELQADGLRIVIPVHVPQSPNYPREERLQAIVNHLTAQGAELDVQQRAGVPKLHITFSRLDVGQIEKDQPMSIAAELHNEFPTADILLNGHFGPLIWSDTKRTPVAVRFKIIRLDLNHFASAGGTAVGDGESNGPFDHLRVSGHIGVPNFHTSNFRTSTQLTLEGSAIVNGATGNTWIMGTNIRFENSEVQVRGSVIYGPDDRRRATLLLTSAHARIEDLLGLYLDAKPPVAGLMTFHGQASFATGIQPFLNRVKLAGDFRIDDTHFRNLEIQRKLDNLSFRIRKIKVKRGTPPASVRSTLAGKLSAEKGRAVFSNMQLTSPGLDFRGSGILNLVDPELDLRGLLHVQSSLSRAVGGFKGIVAFPLNHFFRSERRGAAIPFRIFGRFDAPSFSMSFRKQK